MENFIFRAVRAVILTKNQQVLNLLPQVLRSYDITPYYLRIVVTYKLRIVNSVVA